MNYLLFLQIILIFVNMLVHKSYKFRMYPDEEQKTLLLKHFGCCRLVYNHFLARRKEAYLTEKTSLNYYDCQSELTVWKKSDEYSFLKEVNSQSLQFSIRNLDTAYRKFFDKSGKFPRFKKKGDRDSFTVPQSVRLEYEKLFIPKFKNGIKTKVHRPVDGRILFATLSMNASGEFYVSLTCEADHTPLPKTGKAVGIDTGIKELAILPDGTRYENPKFLKKEIKKVKYLSRQLSKKNKGSSSRRRARIKLAVQHQKLSNKRMDYLHKVSSEIVKNHDFISVEDLAVKNLMKNHHLAQSFSDVALGSFYSMLEYKCKWNGREFVKIDRFFPSSKCCSTCGWINQDLTLQVREWVCPSCGASHDRDINAAKNILTQGLNLPSGCGTQPDVNQKRGEACPLGQSLNPEATYFQ